MMERIAEASPRFKARIADVLYLIIIPAALFDFAPIFIFEVTLGFWLLVKGVKAPIVE